MQIVVQKNQRQFQVLKVIRSRPGGSQFGIGNLFNEVGLAQSGLFCGRELLLAFDVPNQESSFMGISGKYTKRYNWGHFGEHNDNDKPHGRGILISPYGIIHIGYWNIGERAPGKHILIYSDGDLDVGERYLKDGLLFERGTLYRTNGKTEEYDR